MADELVELSDALQLPHPLITKCSYHAPTIESLGLLCARLRSPEDQWSLSVKYACPQSAISEIINETAGFIDQEWSHLLVWDGNGILSPSALRTYADVLHAFGAPTHSVFGFLDCTIHQMCRPREFQELVYTGYKKYHRMKFQGIVVLSGLIAHLVGPYHAPQNNSGVLNDSALMDLIATHAIQPRSQEGDPPERRFFQIYRDSAYGVSLYMVRPFSRVGEQTWAQKEWNARMGGIRISVEHGFGLVLQDWPYLHGFWKHKVLGNACGLMYRVGVLFTNAHACIIPNQMSVRFGVAPPELQEYFHQ
jgi:hypothetical protein